MHTIIPYIIIPFCLESSPFVEVINCYTYGGIFDTGLHVQISIATYNNYSLPQLNYVQYCIYRSRISQHCFMKWHRPNVLYNIVLSFAHAFTVWLNLNWAGQLTS